MDIRIHVPEKYKKYIPGKLRKCVPEIEIEIIRSKRPWLEDFDYDWHKLPLDMKIADIIFRLTVPGYDGRMMKELGYGNSGTR